MDLTLFLDWVDDMFTEYTRDNSKFWNNLRPAGLAWIKFSQDIWLQSWSVYLRDSIVF